LVNSRRRGTKPLPDNVFSQVEHVLFDGELSDEEQEKGLAKKRFRWRGKRRMNAAAGLRLVQKMAEKMGVNEGTLSINRYSLSNHWRYHLADILDRDMTKHCT
jgi:hypothetical protein